MTVGLLQAVAGADEAADAFDKIAVLFSLFGDALLRLRVPLLLSVSRARRFFLKGNVEEANVADVDVASDAVK